MKMPKWFPQPKPKPQKPSVRASQLDRESVRPAPIDPTLESAAREISKTIQEKAGTIAQLSNEIHAMTTDLIRKFEAQSNGKE